MYSVYKLLTNIFANFNSVFFAALWIETRSRPFKNAKKDQYSLNKFGQYKIFIIRPRKLFSLEELKREILQNGEIGPSFPLGL